MKAALAAFLLAQGAFAQTSEEELRPKILSVFYPALAKAAGVQGDVRLRVDSNGVALVSGPPLLREAAIENAKSLGLRPGSGLTYHFVLFANTIIPASMSVKRGDAFDRFFLRMFGLKTEKVVRYNQCVDGAARPNDVKVAADTIDIWINAGAMCAIVD